MPLNMKEARALGAAKLRISDDKFNDAAEWCRQLEIRPDDMGPMTLAFAILDAAGSHKLDDGKLMAELTDALALVAKAEKGWRLEQRGFRL